MPSSQEQLKVFRNYSKNHIISTTHTVLCKKVFKIKIYTRITPPFGIVENVNLTVDVTSKNNTGITGTGKTLGKVC